MIRKRERIIIAKPQDIPCQFETQTLDYDSITKHWNNGWQRAEVDIVRPNHPLNGMAGYDTRNQQRSKISHKFRVFKLDEYESGDIVLWMDGTLPRSLRVLEIMQDKTSRRHINLYCTEKRIGETNNTPELRSSFGSQISNDPLDY